MHGEGETFPRFPLQDQHRLLPGSARLHGPRHLPGLGRSGRVPAARGRAVALRVEPLPKAQRLAPDGRLSLTQHGQAGGAG